MSKKISTVTVSSVKPYGEVEQAFEVCHVEKELSELTSMLLRLNDECSLVMEPPGSTICLYNCYLKEKGLFVAVVNPFEMEGDRCQ